MKAKKGFWQSCLYAFIQYLFLGPFLENGEM